MFTNRGRLDDVYRIFIYFHKKLGKKPGRMTYNPMYEPTYENVFGVVGICLDKWKYFYPDAH